MMEESIAIASVYNPDQNVDVEGATLSDMIYKGATKATTYDTTRPFKVTAYAQLGELVQVDPYDVKINERQN